MQFFLCFLVAKRTKVCTNLRFASAIIPTKSIYILCIYIVKALNLLFSGVILWLSYGYPMVILWLATLNQR